MAKITIPNELSEDIPGHASMSPKTIEMGDRKYAVGGPSEYHLGWTCHTDGNTALRRYRELKKAGYEGVVILDCTGAEAEGLMASCQTG